MNIMNATPKKRLQIPPFYNTRLTAKSELVGPLYTTIHNFEAWVSDCHFEFFPEYTKHGIEHLRYVLHSAFELVHKATRKKITSDDVCALTLAVLLHDAGMYFSADNVRGLLLSTYRDYYAGLSKNETWKQRWEGYIEEAKHWDSAQRQRVLGDLEETFSLNSFHLENKDLRDSDKRFIGEFLRRNHPDLAYTIAMYGLPHEDEPVQQLIDEKITEKMRKIGGMIAFSHGDDLRKNITIANEKLNDNNPNSNTLEVHTEYLMALLRIADILHIHADRARSVFDWNFYNSNSELEQKLHRAIIRTIEVDDGECIKVECNPSDLEVILKLQERFTYLQRELDQCWAVLGGVYKANGFKLRYRRISTSIDDLEEYTTKEELKFIPKRFHLGVAQAEIIKLLIRPLYGDEPKYGIRELLQNAVDAVLERKTYEENHKERSHYKEYEFEGGVEIALIKHATKGKDHPRTTVQVTDKGIGMTEEVIQHYFLTAGASFRNSLAWKKEFEDVDAHGAKSRVCRSGRFGIGVFAAFLLGDKITVTTRHITSEVGYLFVVGQNDELIQVDKVRDVPVGTKIEVEIGERVYNVLNNSTDAWDWFCLEYPKVIRYKLDKNHEDQSTALKQMYRIPQDTKNSLWRRVELSNDLKIEYNLLKKEKEKEKEYHERAMNGIYLDNPSFNIGKYDDNIIYCEFGKSQYVESIIRKQQLINFTDSGENIELDLNRKRILSKVFGQQEIRKVYEDYYKMTIAYMLSLSDKMLNKDDLIKYINTLPKLDMCEYRQCLTTNGYIPMLSESMGYWGIEYVVIIIYPKGTTPPRCVIDENECVYYVEVNNDNEIYMAYNVGRIDVGYLVQEFTNGSLEDYHSSLITPLQAAGMRGKDGQKIINDSYPYNVGKRDDNGRIVLKKPGRDIPDKFITPDDETVTIEFTLGEYNESKPSLFIQTWDKYIGKRAIPYDEEERKRLFPKAYKELGPVIEQFKKRFIEEENEINRW